LLALAKRAEFLHLSKPEIDDITDYNINLIALGK